MSNTIAVAAVFEARAARQGIDQLNGKLDGFGRNVSKVGGVVKSFFAGAALTAGVKSVVSAASDAQQSLGATETVFGQYADKVEKDSKRAARQFGLSANTYRENANLIGSLFKNQGVRTDELATKTKSMIKTASDLAATFGGTTTSAVEALSSAFKGEFDPLERYGISLKQSTVNTEAYRVANVKTASDFGKLSTAQQTAAKQQAVTNLVMKQSKDSAGAFAKETNTLAHQQQVLGAQLDNVKTKIGRGLLPVATSTFSYLSTEGPKAVRKVKDVVQDFARSDLGSSVITTSLDTVRTVASKIGDGFQASIDKLDEFKTKVGSLDLNNLDGKKIGAALSLAVSTGLSGLASLTGKVTAAVGKVLKKVDWVGIGIKAGPAAIGITLGLATGILNGITDPGLWSDIWNHGFDIALAVLAVAFAPAKLVGKVGEILAKVPLVGRFAEWLLLGINGAGQKILGYIGGLFKGIWAGITQGSTPGIVNFVNVIVGNLRGLPLRAAESLKGLAGLLYTRAYQAMFRFGEAIRSGIGNVVKYVAGLPGRAVSAVKSLVSLLPAQGTAAIGRMASAVSSGVGRVVAAVRTIPGRVKGAVSGAAGWLKDAATNTITGFVNGMREKAAALIPGAVSAVADKVKSGLKKALAIFSPSRVTRKLGQYVSQGLALGMLDGTGEIATSVNDLAKIINDHLPKKIKKPKAIAQWYDEHKKAIANGSKDVLRNLKASAKARLDELKQQKNDYAAAVKDAARTFAGLGNMTLGENENVTAGGIAQYLRDRLSAITNFNSKLASIRGRVTDGLYDQIVQMGVDQGTAYAEALSGASPAALAQVNALQTQINTASTALGAATATTMYGAGVASAQGYYDGLQSMLDKIQKQGVKIAKGLVKALKKALGIKSPSRVFKGLGKSTVDGLQIGLDERRMARSGTRLATALQSGFQSPQLDAQLATGMASMGAKSAGDVYQITVRLDNTMTQEEMGVAYNNAIEAAKRIGMVHS